MITEKSKCSRCGKGIDSNEADRVYSVKLANKIHLGEVVKGRLVPGMLYYCSDECLFKRDLELSSKAV